MWIEIVLIGLTVYFILLILAVTSSHGAFFDIIEKPLDVYYWIKKKVKGGMNNGRYK